MRFLNVLLCAAILCVVSPASARADDASKDAKIEELFTLTHSEEMVPQMTQQMMAQARQMMLSSSQQMHLPPEAMSRVEETQKRMMALINERISWQKLRPVLAKVYRDTYTEDELQGIVDFYKTPAGQAMLKKTPLLVQNMMQATQGMMGDMMTEIPRMLDEIEKQYKPTPQ